MLKRKIESVIEEHLTSNSSRILLVDGARQVGKTFIIRHVGQKLFKNFIELNMAEDKLGVKSFRNIKTVDDFYLQLSMTAGASMGTKENTLVFIDEIQEYPELLTLLKFLARDNRFTYIASGSLLGVTLSKTTSIPIGSIRQIRMYPLDFEEFLYANGVNESAINAIRKNYENLAPLDENTHHRILDFFKKYLLVGGMPDAVNVFISDKNIATIREYQGEIHDYYGIDASKYDKDNRLKIKRIYDLVPSNMENKKKRIIVKDIEPEKTNKTFISYQDAFDYLISAGVTLGVQAVSTPVFPLIQSSGKNLLKLYLNDVGLLSALLFGNNIRAILDDEKSINLGSVYETVVACELAAHGHKLFYYDNRSKGEVDYLIDDFDSLSVLPIEVKSGRDYSIHSVLTNFTSNDDYSVKKAYVLSNEREIKTKGKITYLPIYYVMFL